MLFNTSKCKRCGECCRKGGPTLHNKDLPLFDSGLFKPENLVTLRTGELAMHNQEGGKAVLPLSQEMIKIAGKNTPASPWHCVFHQPDGGCTIYAARPLQCRALFCQDPSSLVEVFANPMLARRDVLPLFSPMWLDLAMAHEEICSIATLTGLMAGKSKDEREALRELIRLDLEFRSVAAERGFVPPHAATLVFGRTLGAINTNTQ